MESIKEKFSRATMLRLGVVAIVVGLVGGVTPAFATTGDYTTLTDWSTSAQTLFTSNVGAVATAFIALLGLTLVIAVGKSFLFRMYDSIVGIVGGGGRRRRR